MGLHRFGQARKIARQQLVAVRIRLEADYVPEVLSAVFNKRPDAVAAQGSAVREHFVLVGRHKEICLLRRLRRSHTLRVEPVTESQLFHEFRSRGLVREKTEAFADLFFAVANKVRVIESALGNESLSVLPAQGDKWN